MNRFVVIDETIDSALRLSVLNKKSRVNMDTRNNTKLNEYQKIPILPKINLSFIIKIII